MACKDQPSDPTRPSSPQGQTGRQSVRKRIALSSGQLKPLGSIARLTGSGGNSNEYDSWSENRN
jgi:hypothetical protein